MDHYFISTNNGYIFTNDEKMAWTKRPVPDWFCINKLVA